LRSLTFIPLACLVILGQGCQCNPGLPPTSDNSTETNTGGDSASSTTIDTAPPPPCDVPEVEPNNDAATATPLPTELEACGTFEADLDIDWWSVEVEDDGWLGVRVDAQDIGSTADVAVVVDGPFGSVTRDGNEERNDVDLLVPVGAGRYDILVTEETASSGERYYYDMLATVQKEPFEVDRQDPSTNTAAASALVLQSGERVLGFLDDLATGEDWYVVDVPPGRHLVTIDVQGFAEGSPADTSVWLYDDSLDSLPEGCRMQCEISDGAQPGERDPYFEYDSGGNEAVYVRIRDTSGRTGSAYWYVLRVDVEG